MFCDFSWRRNLPFWKARRCLSFNEVLVNFFVFSKSIREFLLFCIAPGIWSGKCQKLHIHVNCLDVQLQVLRISRPNFSLQGHQQIFRFCRSTLNHNILGNVSYIRNLKEQKNDRVQNYFSIFSEIWTFFNHEFFFETTGCLLPVTVSTDSFRSLKMFFGGQRTPFCHANETSWAKLVRSWMMVWLVLIFNHGFPQSTCLEFFCQGLNQQLCFRENWFNFCIFFSKLSGKFWYL